MTAETGAAGGSAAEAKPLTRFLMFEPLDNSGLNWKIVGVIDADSRDSAEIRFYKDMNEPVQCSPVSENAWKPRTTKPRVVQPRTRVPLEIDLSALPSAASPTAGEDAPDGPDGPDGPYPLAPGGVEIIDGEEAAG